MWIVEDTVPSLHVAVHVRSVLTVSVAMVRASQPSVVRYPSGWTTQLTVTLVTYQPLAPCVPYMIGVTVPTVGCAGRPLALAGSSEDDYTKAREKEPAQAVPGTLRALASPQV